MAFDHWQAFIQAKALAGTFKFKPGDLVRHESGEIGVVVGMPGTPEYDTAGWLDPQKEGMSVNLVNHPPTSMGCWFWQREFAREPYSSKTSALVQAYLANQQQEMTSPKFKIGDRVVLISGYSHSDRNPHWGKEGMYVVGTVDRDTPGDYGVKWDNGERNSYSLQECKMVLESKAPPMPPPVFDETALEPLVIEDATKKEIMAVLKQHKHSDKLFKEWGLGKVIEYGKGMTFMFHGPPGTGKTWAAHCIAKALGAKLSVISSAEIQSSEPGAANRNIQKAFAQAKSKKEVLFIDECDSLIANRHELGMVLGSEVNTLLTEIEKFEGVLILATNMIENMDEALERRISLIVEFVQPNLELRKKIWGRMIPPEMPTDAIVENLAEHELTGGQIKNVILQAARMAVAEEAPKVTSEHFDSAIKRLKSSSNLMGRRRFHRATGHMDVDVKKEMSSDITSFLGDYEHGGGTTG